MTERRVLVPGSEGDGLTLGGDQNVPHLALTSVVELVRTSPCKLKGRGFDSR